MSNEKLPTELEIVCRWLVVGLTIDAIHPLETSHPTVRGAITLYFFFLWKAWSLKMFIISSSRRLRHVNYQYATS